MHNITILNDVILAFDTHFTGFADGGFGTILNIVVVLDDLGADETLFEVGVDDTGTLRGLPACIISSGLHFHLSGGDEGLQIQQRIGFLNQAVHATFLQT